MWYLTKPEQQLLAFGHADSNSAELGRCRSVLQGGCYRSFPNAYGLRLTEAAENLQLGLYTISKACVITCSLRLSRRRQCWPGLQSGTFVYKFPPESVRICSIQRPVTKAARARISAAHLCNKKQ